MPPACFPVRAASLLQVSPFLVLCYTAWCRLAWLTGARRFRLQVEGLERGLFSQSTLDASPAGPDAELELQGLTDGSQLPQLLDTLLPPAGSWPASPCVIARWRQRCPATASRPSLVCGWWAVPAMALPQMCPGWLAGLPISARCASAT